MVVNFSNPAAANLFKWDKDYLFKYLTMGREPILKDPKIIAAFRYLDRQNFLPLNLKEKAYQDIDLEIGYGEVVTRPSVLAQIAELLKPKYGGNYLDLGTGTGYFALVLGYIAGEGGKVFSLERIQWLWEIARLSAANYKDIKNIVFLYRDGSDGLIEQAPFDGIHISYALEEVPENLKMQLKKDGARLICPTLSHDIRVIERHGEDEFIEEIIPGFIFREGKKGVA
jgi:protein-L-isoaspartate(D-aspartate) O-methyltransferase